MMKLALLNGYNKDILADLPETCAICAVHNPRGINDLLIFLPGKVGRMLALVIIG
jgi:hypothetical protein